MQERGAMPKEQGDGIREYSFLSTLLREGLVRRKKEGR